ncbi:hypothetical protein bcgnr5369_08460 [Bacillus cereus]|uniref:hypothetical protein n=1 Tax=Bacillus cereus group TaxID=86661 RepID=UPI00148270E6|nr:MULTISPECIES: hypothetical protein [Bacillus cereus group]
MENQKKNLKVLKEEGKVIIKPEEYDAFSELLQKENILFRAWDWTPTKLVVELEIDEQ